MLSRILSVLVLVSAVPVAYTQTSQGSTEDHVLDKLVLQVKAQPTADRRVPIVTNAGEFAPYIVTQSAMAPAFHAYEEQRIDKEISGTASGGGTSSVVSKGSVPWLFGFALEHGAVTQSVENNNIVFRGNVANVASALKNRDYIQSYLKLHSENAVIRNIAALSFSISLRSKQGDQTTNTLAGYSLHYDIYNHRDPRDRRWDSVWALARSRMGASLPNASGALRDAFDPQQLQDWQHRAEATIRTLSAAPTDSEVRVAVKSIADDLLGIVRTSPKLLGLVSDVAEAIAKNQQIKNEAIDVIVHSPIVSFEYNEVQQTSGDIPTSTAAGAVTPPVNIANLSNFNLIAGFYFIAQSQFTINASTTIFNSALPSGRSGRIRDYRIAGQFDIPLPEIANVGKPTVSFSGLYLHLLEEPLGQQVMVNSVPVSSTGGIGLFQAKLTIPAKGSGVKIPISFTAASRTELIKERDVRGTIGITFDFDSLFSKPQ